MKHVPPATHHFWTTLGHYLISKDFWAGALPNWLIAVGTIGAVVVALWQSRKGTRDTIKAEQAMMTPIVYPEAVYPVFHAEDALSPFLERVNIDVVNFGTGPALNVYAEFYVSGAMYKTSAIYDRGSKWFPLSERPHIHLPPSGSVTLSASFKSPPVEPPMTLRARVVCGSVFDKEFSSPWFTFDIPNDASRYVTLKFE